MTYNLKAVRDYISAQIVKGGAAMNRISYVNKYVVVLLMMCATAFSVVSASAQTNTKKGEIIVGAKIDGYIHLVPITCSLYRNDNRMALEGLAEGIRTFSEITPKIDQNIKIDDPRIMAYPFIYINTGNDFELLETEKKQLGEYLKSGGFVLLEFDILAFRGLKKILPGEIRIKPIADNHEVYKMPFDVPATSWNRVVSERLGQGYTADMPVGAYLTGLFYKGKLVGIYSDKKIDNWNRRLNDRSASVDLRSSAPINTNIKFGINMLHYATNKFYGDGK